MDNWIEESYIFILGGGWKPNDLTFVNNNFGGILMAKGLQDLSLQQCINEMSKDGKMD